MIFIFDENFSYRIAEAFNLLESGNKTTKNHVECRHIIELAKSLGIKPDGSSYTDEQVAQIAGKKNGVIFTQDDDFKSIKHQYPLYKQYKIGLVYFKTTQETRGYWNMVIALITKWEETKEKMVDATPPYCFFVDKKSVQVRPF